MRIHIYCLYHLLARVPDAWGSLIYTVVIHKTMKRVPAGFSRSCFKQTPKDNIFQKWSFSHIIREMWGETLSDPISRSTKTPSYQEGRHLTVSMVLLQKQKILTLFPFLSLAVILTKKKKKNPNCEPQLQVKGSFRGLPENVMLIFLQVILH